VASASEAHGPAELRGIAALSLHAAVVVLLGTAMSALWLATGRGTFWPVWVWVGLAIPLALHVMVRDLLRRPSGAVRGVVLHVELTALVAAILVVVWALAGRGAFWPLWPLVPLLLAPALHALVVFRDRLLPGEREQALVERVDELTRTRRGALDVQAAQLRRIERDLHDGAQARLVAVSMLMGRAEARLEDRPEVAELVRRAREEAGAAIGELRDLARGISPPVLADRGLAAAVEGLGRRALTPVEVEADISVRPPPVVETAAYFVAAEALTNVAKHAPGAHARVLLTGDDRRVVVEVSDDGPGGADATGSGLVGLRQRVQALDGTLSVSSRPGATVVRAELPCGS
jgi:signal transduction histidine kinase